MFSTYYNAAVRKLVVGFGSLFDNIVIRRVNNEGTQIDRIRVPLAYGPSEKFLMRLDQPSSINENQTTACITVGGLPCCLTPLFALRSNQYYCYESWWHIHCRADLELSSV